MWRNAGIRDHALRASGQILSQEEAEKGPCDDRTPKREDADHAQGEDDDKYDDAMRRM